MPFFSVPESDEVADVDADLRTAPWVPGVVPSEFVVARSDRAAVVLRRVAAFREGFELTITAVLHPSAVPEGARHFDLLAGRNGSAVSPEMLRVGLMWPDGGQATNLDPDWRHWLDESVPQAAHGLEEQAGNGSEREISMDYWAWPLPDGGTLRLVVEWPAYGIVETITELDGDTIAAAATRAHPVFDDEADVPSHYSRAAMAAHHRRHHGGAEAAETAAEAGGTAL